MTYREYTPHPLLGNYIKFFWSVDARVEPGTAIRDTILPDGCMEMIFHYGDIYQEFRPGTEEALRQPRCFMFGQITRYIEIGPTGHVGMLSARFYPHGAGAFFSLPFHELVQKTITLEELCGAEGRLLEEKVMNEDTNPARLVHIEKFFLQKLQEHKKYDPRVQASVQQIIGKKGEINIARLAHEMNLSTRQLERQFKTHTGLSAKYLSGITKFQEMLNISTQKRIENLTMLGHESGYYDQAHFIREFRKFAGMTPTEYFLQTGEHHHLFL